MTLNRSPSRAVHADQATGKITALGERGVDPRRLGNEIRIECTDDDAGMLGPCLVEADEMPAIERQDGTPVVCGEGEHGLVRLSPTSSTSRLHRGHIMTEVPQLDDNWQGKILITEQPRHRLRCFVVVNLAIDLPCVRPHISPRIR